MLVVLLAEFRLVLVEAIPGRTIPGSSPRRMWNTSARFQQPYNRRVKSMPLHRPSFKMPMLYLVAAHPTPLTLPTCIRQQQRRVCSPPIPPPLPFMENMTSPTRASLPIHNTAAPSSLVVRCLSQKRGTQVEFCREE